ncbi:helix-turn-helix domain-containing protein [Rhodococcus sp. B50]|uniref:helix-turn-helix domain-containing protein n=1 Tax=Rhodococcus sp. B50 TaxID=2682847 RepID=UPI001BD45711|nr:helix-turn-helix domain-containing protein [Rhodococcus sp. B50]MBS9373636.1 HTH-type transcriptional activator RhaS [Rhodococcus sp. B50]
MDTHANERAGKVDAPPAEEQVWESRAVIERATGVLMERYGLDSDRAKESLLQASRRMAVPMVQLAEDVLASGRAGEPPEIQETLDAASAPSALRKAVAFIESEAARPIRLADIAAAAGVGARALQYDFVRHLHTTPIRYLRSVRLDGAHQDLQAADPKHETVASIAARWGFSSPGRFATQYRSVYGRSPRVTRSDTLWSDRTTGDLAENE